MKKDSSNSTGSKLRMCRKNCGLTQSQVAAALGVERTTYVGYETGRHEPSLENIVNLSQIFRVDPTELLPQEKTASVKDSDSVSSSLKPIYSLTRDEQSLIISYRLLTDKEKSRILAKITNMSADKK